MIKNSGQEAWICGIVRIDLDKEMRTLAISILVVDDDKLLVQKLYETLNWEGLGIGMVFTAYNIRQAKKYLEDYPIELLLCDIDMPQGSGLELLEWIRNEKMDIECAFLSSYANFSYAQQALKLSSREYLLKPISNSELELALSKMVDIVNVKRKTVVPKSDSGKDTFWKDIFKVRFQEEEHIKRAIQEGIYQKDDRFCVDIVKIWEVPSRETYKKDIVLYDFVINNIAKEFFKEEETELQAVVRLSDLEWMLIFHLKEGEPIEKLRFEQLKKLLDKSFSQQCFIFVGKTGDFSELLKLRDDLEEIEKNTIPGIRGILMEDSWISRKREYAAPPWEIWEKEMIRSGQLLEVEKSILEFVKAMGNDYMDIGQLHPFMHELIHMLFRYLDDQGLLFEQIFDSTEFEPYEKSSYLSVTALLIFIQYVFEKLNGNRQNDGRQENIIVQLKEYIEQHLGENLSRSVLAQNVYLSEDYISKIFVKMTGMSIPNYISARRIEKAKEYIKNSSMPISKIALEVGYSNFSYFSKTFRDLVGCTPNEYRNRFHERNNKKLS